MSEQPRQPAGTPTGGQFGAVQRPEADVSLRPLDGSFLYPPAYETTEDVIAFWSQVEVPDDALAKCEDLYVSTREDLLKQMPPILWRNHAGPEWDLANPMPDETDAAATADWEGRRHAAMLDFEQRERSKLAVRKERLNRKDVRPIVRAVAMYSASFEFDEVATRARVLDHAVPMSEGPKTVRQIVEETGLSGVGRFFLDRAHLKPQAIDSETVRKILTEVIERATDEQKSHLDDQIYAVREQLAVVGESIIDAV